MRDQRSFDDFYSASVRRVVSQVHALTGSWADAEDAVQEAYARAWARWGRLRGYHDPEGWVRTVAYRNAVSSWRKSVSRERAYTRHGPPFEETIISPDYVAIIDALRQIPPGQRQAVVLHHLVGQSVGQIARDTHQPEGTVKTLLYRGRHALAGLLADGSHAGSPVTQRSLK